MTVRAAVEMKFMFMSSYSQTANAVNTTITHAFVVDENPALIQAETRRTSRLYI